MSEYKILRGDADDLAYQVNDAIRRGWTLVGGVSIAAAWNEFTTERIFAQAMIRATPEQD